MKNGEERRVVGRRYFALESRQQRNEDVDAKMLVVAIRADDAIADHFAQLVCHFGAVDHRDEKLVFNINVMLGVCDKRQICLLNAVLKSMILICRENKIDAFFMTSVLSISVDQCDAERTTCTLHLCVFALIKTRGTFTESYDSTIK